MRPTRYRIEFADSIADDLRALPKKQADQILRRVARLENGLHVDIKRLQNADIGYRLRVGDHRILFDVERDVIVIQKIGNRKDVYD